MSELKKFRVEKDDFFANHPHSPLTRAQKADFTGLDYFPEASELRLELKVEPLHGQQEIQIQTSTGEYQTYQRYGKLRFQVDNQDVELTLFNNQHGFFLPFVDSLAGRRAILRVATLNRCRCRMADCWWISIWRITRTVPIMMPGRAR